MRRSVGSVIRLATTAGLVGAALTLAACTGSAGGPASSAPRSAGPSTTPSAASGPSSATTSAASASPAQSGSPASTSSARPSGEFTISFAGDVHFSGRVAKRLTADPATVFGQAQPGLTRADLTMVNLETAITTRGTPQAKEYHFRAPPSALTALRESGVDVATMANNHGADYGLVGLRDTIAAITASGFPVIGIGKNATAAFAPYTTKLNGVRVAIIAADQVNDETTLRLFSAGANKPGVANAYSPQLLTAVRRAVAAGYVVIVYLHWGIEYTTCPSPAQSQLSGELARAGVAAVIGTHAHVLQGAGWRPNGTYVAYGLGNYLWWESFGNNQDDNGVLTLTFRHGAVIANSFAPSHLDSRGVPLPATGAEKARIDSEWATDRKCADLSATPPS